MSLEEMLPEDLAEMVRERDTRLAEATALLGRCHSGEATHAELDAFLSRAPAQTARSQPTIAELTEQWDDPQSYAYGAAQDDRAPAQPAGMNRMQSENTYEVREPGERHNGVSREAARAILNAQAQPAAPESRMTVDGCEPGTCVMSVPGPDNTPACLYCFKPAAPLPVRAPNPEAVARILADPDCAAPVTVAGCAVAPEPSLLASALLERAARIIENDDWHDAYDAFRSGVELAPDGSAKYTTLCYEGACATMTGRARPCPIHDAAPEPSADPDAVTMASMLAVMSNAPAHLRPRPEPSVDPDRAFCPQCGIGIAFDEDGLCVQCGALVCSVADARKMLGVPVPGAEAQLAALTRPLTELEWKPNWPQYEHQLLRANTAQAQLLAVGKVRDKLLELAGEFRRNPQVHSTYSECAMRLDTALLTPGGGTGEGK